VSSSHTHEVRLRILSHGEHPIALFVGKWGSKWSFRNMVLWLQSWYSGCLHGFRIWVVAEATSSLFGCETCFCGGICRNGQEKWWNAFLLLLTADSAGQAFCFVPQLPAVRGQCGTRCNPYRLFSFFYSPPGSLFTPSSCNNYSPSLYCSFTLVNLYKSETVVLFTTGDHYYPTTPRSQQPRNRNPPQRKYIDKIKMSFKNRQFCKQDRYFSWQTPRP